MKKNNVKRIPIVFLIIIAVVSFSVIIYATNTITNPTTITLSDPNLYDELKKQLSAKKIMYNGNDVDQTIEISSKDIEAIDEFDFSTSNITDLTGLENFNNLKTLNLSKNTIATASPLSQLTKLQELNISENPINTEILSAISNLTNLNQLDLANTKMNSDQLEYLKNLNKLTTLTLSSNNISAVGRITNLTGITKLDISVNTSFTDLSQLQPFVNITDLNISGTGITSLLGIDNLTNLEKLYAADNKGITSDIHNLYSLSKLKVLNLSSIGINGNRPNISFYDLANLPELEELHLASNEITSTYSINQLANLKILDLKDNKITSINDFVKRDGEAIVTENTLKATKIDLKGNQITDISVLAEYPGDIYWLDLSENHIYSIEALDKYQFSAKNDNGKILYLQNQDITFGLKQKTAEVDHYIILPTIFQYSKIDGTSVYAEDAEFEYTDGVKLNPDYTDPKQYNVIIDRNKKYEDEISMTLNGGNADGTVLHFKLGERGDINCYIESILFKDKNLESAIKTEIEKVLENYNSNYYITIPMIINIDADVISQISELNLQHTDSNDNTKITDLSGLENFYSLVTLYLQNNNISSIKPLETCNGLRILNLSSNSSIGDDNTEIAKLTELTTLNLANTGISNINCINSLNEQGYKKLVILDLSDNPKLADIEGVEKITTLQSLVLANDNLDDAKIEKIKTLTELTTLNINGNQIENIGIISNMPKLKYLYFNNNKVQSLEPIKGKVFYDLEFTGNKIKDITPLTTHRTINNLKMDNNQIEDVTVLSRISMSNEQNLSLAGQKIVKILENIPANNEVTMPLPQIFKASQDSGNKIYSNGELSLTKCSLDESKENVIVNVNELDGDVAQVEITGGKAKGTVLTISAPLDTTITYEPSNEKKTNKNVTATLQFNNNKREATITNNDGKNTYTFEQNGEFTFEFIDKYGIEGSATAIVQNIDKTPPVGTVEQVKKNDSVEVTITVNEKVNDIDGWTSTELEDGTMKLTKTYTEDANEGIKLIDEAGNTSTVNVEVIIKVNDTVTSTTFKVFEDELIIKGINPKTAVSEFKKNIISEMEYQILNKKGTEIKNTDNVGTGCQIKMQNGKTYTLIVWGDLDGDGKISLTELAKISKIGVNKVTPTDLEKSAMDMNMNGKIELSELAAIAKLQLK